MRPHLRLRALAHLFDDRFHDVDSIAVEQTGEASLAHVQRRHLRLEIADALVGYATIREDELQQVVIELPFAHDADWERSLTRLTFPDRNEAWRSELEPATLATITAVQRPTLEAYGYDV